MTDREMLELAAKAFGLERCEDYFTDQFGNHISFNPLIDDGDALRLAVDISRLDGGVALMLNSRLNSIGFAQCYTNENVVSPTECMEDNPLAATRRAIVRAAAEIGAQL